MPINGMMINTSGADMSDNIIINIEFNVPVLPMDKYGVELQNFTCQDIRRTKLPLSSPSITKVMEVGFGIV